MSFGRDTWVCDPVIWRLGGCCPPYLATQRWHSSADGALVNCNPRIDTLGERANDPNRVLGRALASCTYPEPHLRSVTITTERSCLNEFLRHILRIKPGFLKASLRERETPPPDLRSHMYRYGRGVPSPIVVVGRKPIRRRHKSCDDRI